MSTSAKSTTRPFDAGNWFPINNAIFDVIMPRLSPNAFKVLCAVIRKTWGWSLSDDGRSRKQEDQISYSQFLAMTGIKSPSTLNEAIKECLESGMMIRRELGQKMGNPIFYYRLNVAYTLEIEVDTNVTTENEVTVTTENEVTVTTESEVTKQTAKQKKTKDASSTPTPPAVAIFRKVARRYPNKTLYDDIVRTVGDSENALELWENVIKGYIGQGWNPINVNGMLDCYRRGEIPGKAHPNGGNGARSGHVLSAAEVAAVVAASQ